MIKIQITQEDIKKCRNFASKVTPETYDRFKKDEKEREERIFFGKLGEIIFLKLLNSKGITPNVENMFEVWKGTTNVDKFDFETKENKSVDAKTAYKKFHIRILIPHDQFENKKSKDFYVGVKITQELTEGVILGFCSKDKLIANGKHDFGEGMAYWEFLKNLEDINILIKQF